jgi:N utilization substance protein A
MPTELQQMIEVVAKDKGIDPAIVITAIEDAYVAASRKVFKGEEDLRARFNGETGQVELYAVRAIVETVEEPLRQISLTEAQELYGEEAEVGMEIEFPKETERLGRIAAQTAKQVIAQRVREAEREKIHAEFSERVGEVVNATVKRFESGDIIAEIGRVEAQVPRKEQSRAENYAIGDRVRAVIKAVSKNAKGPQVILSRTDPARCARRATGPRWRCTRASGTSIRSARASACAARACRRSSASCAARRSTSSSGRKTR